MYLKRLVNRTVIGIMLLMMACLQACIQSEDNLPMNDRLICWYVTSVEGKQSSRTLIGSSDGETSLQMACTDAEAIAVWGTYTSDNTDNEVFTNTPLTYENGIWYYTGGYRYWMDDSFYKFRACYPRNALRRYITAADANSIEITYDTETLQEDLLVSYKEIETETWNYSDAVPLEMTHALSALRFQFQTVEDVTMHLQSFSLDNGTETGSGLSTSGTLLYDKKEVALSDWEVDTPISGTIYSWQFPVTDSDLGLPFNQSDRATAYQFETNTIVGTQYIGNDGYVLIVPQVYNGKTKMNFTIDNKSYNVNLPAKEFLPGYRYTYLIQVTGDNAVTLNCVVKPWTLKEENMDFENYVNMDTEGQLRWLSGSVEEKENHVNEVFLNAETIQCTFHIATPEGATWYANLVPVDGNDMNAFTFVNDAGEETGLSISGEVGKTAVLTIKRKAIKEYTRMRLQLIVKDLNGRTFLVHQDILGSVNYIWCQP